MAKPVFAEKKPFRVLLFSGAVFVMDQQGQRKPVTVNQEISSAHYTSIQLTSGARLFLQKGRQLLRIDTSGTFQIDEIDRKTGSGLSNALQFLSALSKPRSFSRQVNARGKETAPPLSDADYFYGIWENLVLNQASSTIPIASEDLLAAAAWFHQQGNQARTAYILEHLDLTTRPRNPFLQQLRSASLSEVSLATINVEVENTRRNAGNRLSNFRYMALLIGINRYDNSAWQPLTNPIEDIAAIRNQLIDSYRFRPEDIISLENPTFSQIIDSFHTLKKKVDNRTHLMIYYAGHGYYPADEEEGYWIPKNGGDPSTQRFFIPTSTVLSKMKAIKSRHTLLIADSCFSGSLVRKSRGPTVPSGFYRELSQKKSRQIITSGGLEPVSDSGGRNHSIFAGNLLEILSKKRAEPLSASELAVQLRKSLKNTGAEQTPEYGRLYIADDENGEFFFVHKDQSLVFAENKSDAPSPSETDTDSNKLEYIGMSNPPQNDGSAFQSRNREHWGFLGVIHYQGRLEYNYQPTGTVSSQEKLKIAATMEGNGLKAEYRLTNHKRAFGLSLDLGQLTTLTTCTSDKNSVSGFGFQSCEEEGQFDSLNSTTLSGLFSHLGVFVDYSVLIWRAFSLQLGGEIQYQYYALNEFLEEKALDSSTLGACSKVGVSYRNNDWSARLLFDLCLTAFEFGGSLHQVENSQGEDVRMLGNIVVGLAAGYQF
ncbi:MAG: caspase family protein [Deltaproteobacteria bacterium]|nr:caspase family protein [Deltaproteobacteria bacterium]MBT4637311.1 caspase family protein [Deltaproteobacteria bacterium]MBT6504355.1 caspase family protein [Deltaproteobacteria bacterium]MBT6614586.1 caspase family protein [Deltaproteobacteria bacterium]MBT7154559.1 caspase family protein [Deltaproteobacteria bacterium]